MISLPLVVLAGGFGTRLRSAVGDVPKPMAPVADAPFLRHLLENWVDQGVRRFVFALHHQADVIISFVDAEKRDGVLRGCEAACVVETQPLGTGGAIANAVLEAGVHEPFLVGNADTWLGAGLPELARCAAPAIAVIHVDDTKRYGSVSLKDDRAAAFAEKQLSGGPGWVNAGLYLLEPDLLAESHGRAFSLEVERLPGWAREGRLSAARVSADFIDIGIPDDYFRFCRWVEAGKSGAV